MSGRTRARPTPSARRTLRSRPSSRAPVSSTASGSSGAATPGRSGATRQQVRCWPPRTTSNGAHMRKTARVSVRLAALPAGLAIVVAGPGWLYVVAPGSHLPGPTVGDALPLDELAKHSAAPLLLFVAAWGGAAPALGCPARPLAPRPPPPPPPPGPLVACLGC